ncbi:MAG: bifunctional protein-serine/threonine kinase/phosphatase [Acetobacteraceae bacterium]|nr:bifunctional protein-serine/threonine kinase/phosphatase [Pseudomonadota bacterium]
MSQALAISIGQWSEKGRKDINQDFHGAMTPAGTLLALKGVAVALADGISGSAVSNVASESAVKAFLTDYYATSETWSVKTAGQRVIAAANSWLHGQTRRGTHPYEPDKGYVCTFTALVIKGDTAHVFHVGDSRVYRLNAAGLEQLTDDHRIRLSSHQVYLGRALGVNPHVEIDYRMVQVQPDDLFILATDGVHEYAAPQSLLDAFGAHRTDLDEAARKLVQAAYEAGSPDNLTVQVVRIDATPDEGAREWLDDMPDLPPAPLLQPGSPFEGYEIIRQLHASSRSHVYLAVEPETATRIALKVPSTELKNDPAALKRFMMEEWIARRINSPNVLKPRPRLRPRAYLYLPTEFIEGQTLTQWMADHPAPSLQAVRDIVKQIANGLRAFHRLDMLHQDLRPDNIMIDRMGTAKIIDFGSTRIAGIAEAAPASGPDVPLGTVQYMAPEYLLDGSGTEQSDLFSLGVITYQMLTGRLPYGAAMARVRSKAALRKVTYTSASSEGRAGDRPIPAWIDGALRRAVHPDPARRHEAISEFIYELQHPNPAYTGAKNRPLMERNPLAVWQTLVGLLVCVIIWLATRQLRP